MNRFCKGGSHLPESWQVERLHHWCVEWALDQALAGEEGVSESGGRNARADALVTNVAAEPLETGTVALLAPLSGQAPFYVMLLEDADSHTCFCIPFSRFTVPATPKEVFSGLAPDALRVLCLWNARPLQSPELLTGWTVATPDATARARIGEALLHVRTSGGLPESMAQDAGPPLIHPEDPRRIYLRKARQLMDHQMRAGAAGLQLYELPVPDVRHLPRAAEPPDIYRTDETPDERGS